MVAKTRTVVFQSRNLSDCFASGWIVFPRQEGGAFCLFKSHPEGVSGCWPLERSRYLAIGAARRARVLATRVARYCWKTWGKRVSLLSGSPAFSGVRAVMPGPFKSLGEGSQIRMGDFQIEPHWPWEALQLAETAHSFPCPSSPSFTSKRSNQHIAWSLKESDLRWCPLPPNH